jgi:hypothetical protein
LNQDQSGSSECWQSPLKSPKGQWDLTDIMLKLWNFSSTLGRPNSEEKERKRRLREEQLQQIQKELTLDRRLINGPSWKSAQQPQRAKTFRHTANAPTASNATNVGPLENGLSNSLSNDLSATKFNNVRQNNFNNLRFRSKSSHKLDEDSQFVSRLRFFDDRQSSNPPNPLQIKRHSSAFLTPGDDDENNPRSGPDLYGMRRRYTTAFDSDNTDFTASTSGGGGRGVSDNRGGMDTINAKSANKKEQILRFSDQADMSTTSGTNRSSFGGTSDDGFADYNNRSDTISHFRKICHTVP